MKKQIWKYGVEDVMSLPIGAEIITVKLQNEVPVLWALVNTKAKKEPRYFKVFGTGWDIDTDTYPIKEHLGTIESTSGMRIWHVFEIQAP